MEKRRIIPRSLIAAGMSAVLLWATSTADGGARRFTYVYEATTAAPGSFEVETWATWKTSPREERRFNALDFRHEIEFGITDRLQAAIYVADWGYLEDPLANERG